jgi:hypothetical protein
VYVDDDINSNVLITTAHFLTLNPKTGIPNKEISNDSDYKPYTNTGDILTESLKRARK